MQFLKDGVQTVDQELLLLKMINLVMNIFVVSGECKAKFTSRKVPYCIKYHPEDDKQHLFVAGTSDKKIVCVSIVQK